MPDVASRTPVWKLTTRLVDGFHHEIDEENHAPRDLMCPQRASGVRPRSPESFASRQGKVLGTHAQTRSAQ